MTSWLDSRAPTLAPLLHAAGRGVRRYPLTVAAGAAATVFGIMLADGIGDERMVEPLLVAAILGVPLFTSLRLLGTRFRWGAGVAWAIDAVGLLLLAGFVWGWTGWSEPVRVGRALQLGVVFGLFVSVAPSIGRPEDGGFWTYSRLLVERAVVAFIYAHVLFAGAAIALLALDNLFGVALPEAAYGRLWFVAWLFLSPWFFVAGLPDDPGAMAEREYPAGLRAFTRFALLPIVAIYLLILLVYFGKVLVTWEWPSGWIGWLVSVVGFGGIGSLVLVHPLLSREGERWVRTYARGFYVLLLPAIVMLWLAIWQRVAQYGITEPRYFLTGISVWLAGIAVYQLVTGSRGIRIIPASLCVLGLVTYAGPWGAYDTAERSQVHRLAGLLQQNGLLTDGQVTAADAEVPADDRREIEATLRYLAGTHGLGAVARWFPEAARSSGVLADAGPRSDAGRAARHVMRALALAAAPPERTGGAFRFTARQAPSPIATAGYDLLLRVDRWSEAAAAPSGWSIRGDSLGVLTVTRDGEPVARFALEGLAQTLGSGTPRRSVAPEELRIVLTEPVSAVLSLRVLGGRFEDGRPVITDAAGEVLVAVSR